MGHVAARATVGYHAAPVLQHPTNYFVENDKQKRRKKKEKKKKITSNRRQDRARVPVIDFCCLIARTDSFCRPYDSW